MSTNSSDSIIMNPNQAEFPITNTVTNHPQKVGMYIATCVSDGEIKVGTEIKHIVLGKKDTLIVTEVLESRPAKGDYSGDIWKGTSPTWNKVECKTGFVTPPKPEDAIAKK